MSDVKVIVDVLGDKLELILPDDWKFSEGKLAMEISNGLAPLEIQERLGLADPYAWSAVLHISFARAGREITDAELDDVDMGGLGNAVLEAVMKATESLPPTEAKKRSSSGQGKKPAGASAKARS